MARRRQRMRRRRKRQSEVIERMSDSRFYLRVEFEIYGQQYTWCPSLNYFDNGDDMDDRITAFFVTSYRDAYNKFHEYNCEVERKARAVLKEKEERALLALLSEKYKDA